MSPDHSPEQQRLRAGWRDAVLVCAAYFQINVSPEHVRLASQWDESASLEDRAREMARQAGLSLQMVQPRLAAVSYTHLTLPTKA